MQILLSDTHNNLLSEDKQNKTKEIKNKLKPHPQITQIYKNTIIFV